MRLRETLESDLPKIREWIQADPFHRDDPRNQAETLLTGKGLLAFKVVDDFGDVLFIRLDADNDMVRWSAQFGPGTAVSKRQVVDALLTAAIPAVLVFSRGNGFKGIVYESVNPPLIEFMKKQGFSHLANDDYAFIFEGTCVI
jgi:hypothetical protein